MNLTSKDSMRHRKNIYLLFWLLQIASVDAAVYTVNNNADDGSPGTLRWAIQQVNAGSGDDLININIPGAPAIVLTSDLPALQQSTRIVSANSGQAINGNNAYRAFATNKSSLLVNNLTFNQTRAIGGSGSDGNSSLGAGAGGGGLGAGGAIYIDLGQTLTLANTTITSCSAVGGAGGNGLITVSTPIQAGSGGGASWSINSKNGGTGVGGGDHPGGASGGNTLVASPGSLYQGTLGYGGGSGGNGQSSLGGAGGGRGPGSSGTNGVGGDGGYCGGGGGGGYISAGGGGNGGGIGGAIISGSSTYDSGGAGGYGSGAAGAFCSNDNYAASGGGGGFGGGGGGGSTGPNDGGGGGGGFGGGGGGGSGALTTVFGFGGDGGLYGGAGGNGGTSAMANSAGGGGGGGAGIGGAIFVGDNATLELIDAITMAGNSVAGGAPGTGGNGGAVAASPGMGFAADVFLFQNAGVNLPGSINQTLAFAIDADPNAPLGLIDRGITKTGTAVVTLSGTNSYRGGTNILGGVLQVSSDSNLGNVFGDLIFNNGATLQTTATFSSIRSIFLEGNGEIFVNPATTLTLNGIVSDAGQLTKSGTGILALSGVNTYTGPTVVQAGQLSLTLDGSISNSSALALASATTFDVSGINSETSIHSLSGAGNVNLGTKTLIINQDVNAAFSGAFSGSERLFKTGNAVLNLLGTSPFAGQTHVLSGILAVNGSLANSVMAVYPQAILTGSGIVGDVIVAGTVAPGGSIGTLEGNSFHFLNGSNLNIDISALANDLVIASTNFTLDSGVTLNVLAGPRVLHPGNVYTIVQAPVVSGVFSRVTSIFPRFKFTPQYFPTHIDLVTFTNSFVNSLGSGASATAIAVAEYLDLIEARGIITPGGDLAEALTIASYMTSQQMNFYFPSLAPNAYNNFNLAQQNVLLDVNEAILDHLESLYMLACTEINDHSFHAWLEPIGSFSKQQRISDNDGYKSRSAGFLFGYDRFFDKKFYVGIATGYTYADVDQIDATFPSNGHVQAGYLSLYGRYWKKSLYADLVLTGSFDSYKANRTILLSSIAGTLYRKPHASYTGYDSNVHLGVGKVIHQHGIIANLFLSGNWLRSFQNRISESGANDISLIVNKQYFDLIRTEAGLLLSKCLSNWSPEIGFSLAYDKRFGGQLSSRFVDNIGTLVTNGLAPSRLLLLPKAKISAAFLDDSLSASFAYEGKFGSKYLENNLWANVGYHF